MTPSSPQRPQRVCGFCGYADTQPFTFCPNCGRSTAAMSNAETQAGASGAFSQFSNPTFGGQTFGSSPTQAATSPYQAGAQAPMPPTPGFNSLPTAQGGPSSPGMFSPYGPAMQAGPYWGPTAGGAFASQPVIPPPPRKRWGRGKLLAVWGGVSLALLLVITAGAFYVYTAFLANNPVQSARYLPGNTLVYTTVDLVNAAKNGSKLSQGDVNNTANTSTFEQATGLNFQTDVLPWLKSDFSYALVHISQTSNQFGGSSSTFDTVFLISTKDTNASNAAIAKAVKNQEDKYGVKFTNITYNGVTLQSDVDSARQSNPGNFGPTASPLVLGVVSDQVIVASSVTVAEQVVDRANNSTDRLSDNSAFKDAISKLPSDRFATFYVNVHDLVRATLTPGQNNDNNLGQIDNYPVAYGYLQNTSDGIKAGFTLQAKAGTHLKYAVNGDTTLSASVVPDTAIAYGGLGNVGNFYQEVTDLAGGDGGTGDSFRQEYGLGPDDPLFQAPLSFALLASPQSDTPDVLVMLHVSGDTASADAKIQGALQNAGYVTSTSTVSGVTVTEIKQVINLDNGTDNPNPGTVPPTVTETQGYYAVVGHDLVFGSTLDAITQSINAAQGTVGSLAKSSAFQNVLKQGPKNMALSLFISLDNLAKAPGPLGDSYRDFAKHDTSLLSKVKTAYLIYGWDDSGITLTEVITLK
jgi:hypothetical protein